ncbi:MAG: DNA repair protein RecO, partial [Candidatus Staskawiczbacteria bacterium RIFOXYD2_FULL_37_10]
ILYGLSFPWHTAHLEIWEFLIDVFGKLNNPQLSINNKQLILCYFIWNFFAVLGYKPEISKCAVCQGKLNPYNIYFSNKEGGVICKKCLYADKEAEKINSDVVKILRLILKKDWQVVSKLKIEPASQNLFDIMSNNYYNHILSIFSFK